MVSVQFGIDLLLCLCVICRASELTTQFKAEIISTTWKASDALPLGKLSLLDCMVRCTDAADKCYAFHFTSSDDCYHLKENKNWMEQRPKQNIKFWVKQKVSEIKCRAPVFPDSYGKSRYYFERTNRKTWNESAVFCESIGGKLVQISTAIELEFVWKLINSPTANPGIVFVGGYKDQNDGLPHRQGWKWHGSEEPVYSSLWSRGEPNNHFSRNEYYASFWETSRSINDVNDNLNRFVCECSMM